MTTENEKPANAETPESPGMLDELDTIRSNPSDPFPLSSGTRVRTVRLRTRETMALLKILTAGAGDVLAQTQFSADMDKDEFIGIFIGSVILSVPEAETETIDFVRRMVIPEHYIDDARTKPEMEANADMMSSLFVEMDNPPLDDTIEILERVIRIEAPHILALGKRLAALLEVQKKSKVAKSKSPRKSRTSSKASEKD